MRKTSRSKPTNDDEAYLVDMPELDTSIFPNSPDQILDQNSVFVFNEDFTQQSAGKAIKFILSKNFLPKKEQPHHITLVIMSNGGDLAAAFGLIDVMFGSRIPVYTLGLGTIASAGFFTFIAGAKGHRTITPNTSILSHQFSWDIGGKEHELVSSGKEIKLTSERMIAHITKCTGIADKKIIRKKLLPPTDCYLTAAEAVTLGAADDIVDFYTKK